MQANNKNMQANNVVTFNLSEVSILDTKFEFDRQLYYNLSLSHIFGRCTYIVGHCQ